MSYVPEVAYCPYRTNVGSYNIQFSDFSNVQYFQQSDSEGEDDDPLHEQGKHFCGKGREKSKEKKNTLELNFCPVKGVAK